MENRKKVLLAENVNPFLELEKSFLERADIDLLVARNGREVLQLVREHRPQLAFLDLHMPEMDGDECCRQIKDDAELSDTAVVMVTTAEAPGERERCLSAGCDEIIEKPISRGDFVKATNRYLMVDPRRETRFVVRVEILYGPNQHLQLTGFSVNMSTGGVFVETQSIFSVGENLTLVFSLPGQTRLIRCQAQVAWINEVNASNKPLLPAGFGVQFVDTSLEDLRTIRNYLINNDLQPAP